MELVYMAADNNTYK